MTRRYIRMSGNPHVVRRIQKRRIDSRFLADQAPNEGEVACVATTDTMLTEYPDVAQPGPRRRRHLWNDLVLRIGAPIQNDVQFARRETGQGEIEVEIQGSQLGQLQSQDIKVLARPERNLIVGDPQCAFLGLAQPRYV